MYSAIYSFGNGYPLASLYQLPQFVMFCAIVYNLCTGCHACFTSLQRVANHVRYFFIIYISSLCSQLIDIWHIKQSRCEGDLPSVQDQSVLEDKNLLFILEFQVHIKHCNSGWGQIRLMSNKMLFLIRPAKVI